MKHPTLFKQTATGASQFWEIQAVENDIITRWGQVGGAVQETSDIITEGKNLGKKNESTPVQQAALEAEAQWNKKLKCGYVQSLDAAKAGEVDACITGGISPMLAHKFSEHGHKFKYPGYLQPKLDGHRCIAVVEPDGTCTLWTRSRKPISSVPHIVKAVEGLGLKPGIILDGELYRHSYKDKFEELTSLIRASEPRPGHEVVQFHVYDMAIDGDFAARIELLGDISVDFADGPLVLVRTEHVYDEDTLMELFDAFLADGYEGGIARNAASPYVNKRSYDLQKIKEFDDGEFEITGLEEGRGKLAGHAIFICKTAEGTEFRTKMKGDTSVLKQYWDNPALVMGRRVTVQYFGMTNKNGVPRFPVAVRFREDA